MGGTILLLFFPLTQGPGGPAGGVPGRASGSATVTRPATPVAEVR